MIRKLIKERSGCGEKLICLYQILTFKRIRMVQNPFFFLYFNVLYVCIYLTKSVCLIKYKEMNGLRLSIVPPQQLKHCLVATVKH